MLEDVLAEGFPGEKEFAVMTKADWKNVLEWIHFAMGHVPPKFAQIRVLDLELA